MTYAGFGAAVADTRRLAEAMPLEMALAPGCRWAAASP
jgi:hypothetical protein